VIVSRLNNTFDHIPRDKPFFLYFGFNQTHRPFMSDTAISTRPSDHPARLARSARRARGLRQSPLRPAQHGSPVRRDHGAAETRGLDKNTIVVFMGDNGEAMYRGKGTLYERAIMCR
jgi:arylsulfatase A-like enzyme